MQWKHPCWGVPKSTQLGSQPPIGAPQTVHTMAVSVSAPGAMRIILKT